MASKLCALLQIVTHIFLSFGLSGSEHIFFQEAQWLCWHPAVLCQCFTEGQDLDMGMAMEMS